MSYWYWQQFVPPFGGWKTMQPTTSSTFDLIIQETRGKKE